MKHIFISHKRVNGNATAEAILIKNAFDKLNNVSAFMDVRETYIGDFPKTLMKKINTSDIFIFIIPSNNDVSFLSNAENWVYREIKQALTLVDIDKNVKILPISFKRDFVWPQADLGEINGIKDYNIHYFDTNDSNSEQRLYDSLMLRKSKGKMVVGCIAAILLCLSYWLLFTPKDSVSLQYPESKEFVSAMTKISTIDQFGDANQPTGDYLQWYRDVLESPDGKKYEIQKEFNDCFLKERCIRLLVIVYMSFTGGDLDNVDVEKVNKIVNDCYANIPKDKRTIFVSTSANVGKDDLGFSEMMDVAIDYLESREDIKSIPPESRALIKAACVKVLWPSDNE